MRVVILGQDPYHGPGQAHGLCFSVQPGVRPPPSLGNIYKELESDLGLARPSHGFLEHWARQGVLLLNSVLTVEMGRAASHQGKGWERFTDAVIRLVNAGQEPVVFMLWGSYAQKKAMFVDGIDKGGRHLVLKAAHPSPLSAHNGFFRLPAFFKGERVPGSTRPAADRLGVARGLRRTRRGGGSGPLVPRPRNAILSAFPNRLSAPALHQDGAAPARLHRPADCGEARFW